MSSSIFSFRRFALYGALPASTRRWHALLVGSTLLTVVLCMQCLRSMFRDPRWRANDASVLCIGTSRARDGIRLSAFPWPTGKMTLPALDHATSAAALTAHQQLWPQLSLVLIEVDEFSLFSDSVRTHWSNFSELCGPLDLSALATPRRPGDTVRDLRRILNLLSGNGVPALHHQKRLTVENVSPRPQARKPRRFDGARWRLNRSTARHRIRHARSDVFFGSAASENAEQHNIPALVDLVAHLRRRGIAVVLVAFPCHAASAPPCSLRSGASDSSLTVL